MHASNAARRNLVVLAVAGAMATVALPVTGAASIGSSDRWDVERLDAAAAIDEVPEGGLDGLPTEVDPQSWVLPEWMGFEDYTPIPGIDWNDPALQAPKPIRAALILGDFQDRDFIVTEEPGSEHFCLPVDPITKIFDPARGPVPKQDPELYPVQCNPFMDGPIAREDVADFYANFYFNEPSEANYFHTGNEFWLENSWGLIGVDSEGFGPYRLSAKEHEYGLGGGDAGNAGDYCPAGDNCEQGQSLVLIGGFDTELFELSAADVAAAQVTNGEDYDFRYLLHAGYDESGTWQQFGEILFEFREDVTDEFGPPNADELPDDENWVNTRYIDWTSFAAGEGIWSHALPGILSTQGESDGGAVFAHELSHIFGVLDNYNNPFQPGRSYTGLWANLSRGSFGGPGGHHNRWQIPPTLGASMPSHHMLRNKIRLGFFATRPNELSIVSAQALQATGPQFATIYPRAYPLFPTTDDQGLHGMVVEFGADQEDCTRGGGENLQCSGGGYDSYTVEFVDRIGFDSYTTDHGILLAKVKQGTDLAPFMWAIDSHPQDLNEVTPPPPNQDRDIVDFIRPVSEERVPVVEGDARQLADALFHAGNGEGVVSEYIDEDNRLHFYTLDFDRDERGVATYRVAVRHLDNGGPFPRGVTVEPTGSHSAEPGKVGVVTFDVTNTGTGAADLIRLAVTPGAAQQTLPDNVDPALLPSDPGGDAGAAGVETFTHYTVLEVQPGETVEVPVWFSVPDGTDPGEFEITLTATSDTDPSASATAAQDGTIVGAGEPAVVEEPAPAPEPEPEPEPAPLPVTGGGLALAALLAGGAAYGLRRR